jgi:hypothetical protein
MWLSVLVTLNPRLAMFLCKRDLLLPLVEVYCSVVVSRPRPQAGLSYWEAGKVQRATETLKWEAHRRAWGQVQSLSQQVVLRLVWLDQFYSLLAWVQQDRQMRRTSLCKLDPGLILQVAFTLLLATRQAKHQAVQSMLELEAEPSSQEISACRPLRQRGIQDQ